MYKVETEFTYIIFADVEFLQDGHAEQMHEAAWPVIQHARAPIPHILKNKF